MRLTTFCKEFDVDQRMAYEWVHSRGFPAYKIGGSWYVDLPKYYKWREQQHMKSYKYA